MRVTRVLALPLCLAACRGGEPFPVNCTDDLRFSVTPAETTVAVGDSFAVAAPLYTCGGSVQLPDTVRWQADDIEILDVSPGGLVYAAAAGDARIIARSRSHLSDSVVVHVRSAGMAFTELVHLTAMTGMLAPGGRLIADDAAWAAAWDEMHATYGSVPPRPAVDFQRELVVLAAAGQRPAQGFLFYIADIQPQGGTVHVSVLERWPTCATLPALSAPVHAVRIPRLGITAATFTTRRHQLSC